MDDNPTAVKGKLIVFEGIDRSGKTSQIKLLSERLTLENIPHQTIGFPDRSTRIGSLLEDYLKRKDEEMPRQALHLLFSANRWENMSRIAKLLESGTHVLLDRYAYSGISYSVGAEGLNFDWCKVPDCGIVEPDVVFFMNVSAQNTCTRSSFGDEIYEKVKTLEKVYDVFRRFDNLPYWRDIDASDDPSVIHEKIYKTTMEIIKGPDRPLTKLKF
ncbi:thymidylate kinase, putative [Theileria equi strain WA]|uniref:dTMP kinase n=1 Tax=Theileria equi strain WA TaxID=1537102 RepID=L0AUF2_THEEQ|nr:thymidylate kinase, putative [Theileria equi strain WA]AFZ79185.1 thymidylate kinase, putative [Theileria equi strain WA]|eukprot:XP_004828851.1 thymidylate kinase, putative [Theileria equi strain WA]